MSESVDWETGVGWGGGSLRLGSSSWGLAQPLTLWMTLSESLRFSRSDFPHEGHKNLDTPKAWEPNPAICWVTDLLCDRGSHHLLSLNLGVSICSIGMLTSVLPPLRVKVRVNGDGQASIGYMGLYLPLGPSFPSTLHPEAEGGFQNSSLPTYFLA